MLDLELTLFVSTSTGPSRLVDLGPRSVAGLPPDPSEGITQRLGACDDCPADLNGDGVLDFFDVSVFLNTMADLDGNGIFDFFDVSAFLNQFAVGCP